MGSIHYTHTPPDLQVYSPIRKSRSHTTHTRAIERIHHIVPPTASAPTAQRSVHASELRRLPLVFEPTVAEALLFSRITRFRILPHSIRARSLFAPAVAHALIPPPVTVSPLCRACVALVRSVTFPPPRWLHCARGPLPCSSLAPALPDGGVCEPTETKCGVL